MYAQNITNTEYGFIRKSSLSFSDWLQKADGELDAIEKKSIYNLAYRKLCHTAQDSDKEFFQLFIAYAHQVSCKENTLEGYILSSRLMEFTLFQMMYYLGFVHIKYDWKATSIEDAIAEFKSENSLIHLNVQDMQKAAEAKGILNLFTDCIFCLDASYQGIADISSKDHAWPELFKLQLQLECYEKVLSESEFQCMKSQISSQIAKLLHSNESRLGDALPFFNKDYAERLQIYYQENTIHSKLMLANATCGIVKALCTLKRYQDAEPYVHFLKNFMAEIKEHADKEKYVIAYNKILEIYEEPLREFDT